MKLNRETKTAVALLVAYVQDYLDDERALIITTDGLMNPISCCRGWIDKSVIEEAVHGHIEFSYKRKEFVVAMNEEQDTILLQNWLASYLADVTVYGDVVLLNNRIEVYDDTHEK